MKKITAAAVALVLFLSLSGCGLGAPPPAGKDEIVFHVQMDVAEDFGLLVIDYAANGSDGSGGVSNADQSLLKHDELVIFSYDRETFENPSDVMELTLRFTVITEYFSPNYDNIYPEECTKPMDAITFDAAFGQTYRITVSGDAANGFTAVFEG